MSEVWDSKIANASAMVDHCIKLGAVIVSTKPKAGFAPPEKPKGTRR